MFTKNQRLKALATVVLTAVLLTSVVMAILPGLQARSLFDSPLPTPSPPPSPSPTPWPTISPDLPSSERALRFVAQREDIPQEWLILADSFTVEFPLTGVTLWRGLVLDVHSKHHPLYEVFIHEGTEEILTGNEIDPQIYWQAEETAFRERIEDHILDLVARRAKAPADKLEIVAGFLQQDPFSGQWVWQGKVIDTVRGQIYRLAVDAQGQEINPEDLEKASAKARRAKYGKLEPKLFYLLPTLEAEEKIKVLLWVGGVDYAWVDEELARLYPQVKADYFAGGQPFTGRGRPARVEPELFEKIRADYNDLLDQAHRKATEPVAAFLKKRDYEAEVVDVFPGVVAELPANAIEELNRADLDNLSTIYHAEVEVTPQMDSVAKTIRVESVWDGGSGYTSQGVRLGMMDAGIVDPNTTHPAFQNKTIIAPRPGDVPDFHAAVVAGVMFGSDSRPAYSHLRGIGYGSTELVTVDVNNSWSSIYNGLDDLVDYDAFVINASLSTEGSREMQAEDRVLDYLVRYRDPTVVVGSGNAGSNKNVSSPGKAYNVITVGGLDDHNDPYWHNDSMWADSCYVDPYVDDDPPHTHAKPDVVAVGADVVTVCDNYGDTYCSWDGTSVAAPQVTGLAALLVQHYYWLRVNPETVKAIIMASAIHNIEGDARLSDKDGAGGIVASEALAVFERGGWAHHIIYDINDPNHPSNPFSGNGTDYEFRGGDTGIWDVGTTYAYKGERVRAALCWNSNPTGDFENSGTNKMSTELDLTVIAPNGAHVAYSTTSYNSCEVAGFVADQNGEYRMEVTYWRRSQEGLNLGLGLAWLRVLATYLPDIKANYNGWTSEIVIRNDGATTKKVTITYLYSNGNYAGKKDLEIPHNGTKSHRPTDAPTYLYNFTGSAIVSASEDVSVVVENNNGERSNNYNGISAGGLDPGWGQTGTDIYVPLVKYRHGSEDKTSRFYILNTGTANATVTIYGYDENGDQKFNPPPTTVLAPNALWSPRVPSSAGFGRFSAWIDSTQPLAVVVAEEQHTSNTVYKIQNAFASGDTTVFAPQVKRNWVNGDFTTLAVQTTNGVGTNVTVTYYPNSGGTCSDSAWVSGNGYHVFLANQAPGCPDEFVGSARVSGGQPLAVLVNETSEKGYSGFLSSSQTVVLPHVRTGGWHTGIRVMNADGGSPTSGTIYFYNSDGSSAGSANFTISGGYESVNLGQDVPGGFNGSAIITVDRPIVTSVILTQPNDRLHTMMYNGSNR